MNKKTTKYTNLRVTSAKTLGAVVNLLDSQGKGASGFVGVADVFLEVEH
jgi:hypothetical protein